MSTGAPGYILEGCDSKEFPATIREVAGFRTS
jgi:hypothetical protein